jgi:thiol-disulfide isomerase/thioredoxin
MKNKITLLFSLATIAFSLTANAQVSYSQDFEGAGVSLPTGWTQTSNATSSDGFIRGNAAALSSTSLPFDDHTTFIATNDDGCGQSCDKSNDFVSSPSIDLTGVTSPFLKVDIFFGGGSYQGITEQATIEASTDNGTTWTIISTIAGAAGWRTDYINLSAYANVSSLKIGFRYKDNGGWLYGLGIDNFSIFTPAQNAVDLVSLNIQTYVVQSGVTIGGEVFNSGASPITSIVASYTVSGGNAVNATINGLNIAPLTSGTFSHPTQWIPSSTGATTVSVTVNNPNGVADIDISNNTLSKNVVVATQSVQRLPLIEEFTSSTCPPCAGFNTTFNPLLEQFQSNSGPDASVAVVKYQMNYPSPGNDPSYNVDANTRSTYYSVPGIPDPFLDGTNVPASAAFIQGAVDTRRSDIAVMNIAVDATNKGDSLSANVTVTPYANFPAGFKLYIAVTEDRYEYTGTNGETEFHHVMRKMLPNASGITLTAMTPNTPINFLRKYKFSYNLDNTSQGTYSLWGSDFSNITVVAWVQDPSTKEVFQATFDESVTSTTGINEDENGLEARFYPNPSSDATFMNVNVPTASKVSVEVFNLMGQRVGFQSFGTQYGTQTFKYDTSDLTSGVYLFNLTVGNKKVTRKVSVSH